MRGYENNTQIRWVIHMLRIKCSFTRSIMFIRLLNEDSRSMNGFIHSFSEFFIHLTVLHKDWVLSFHDRHHSFFEWFYSFSKRVLIEWMRSLFHSSSAIVLWTFSFVHIQKRVISNCLKSLWESIISASKIQKV